MRHSKRVVGVVCISLLLQVCAANAAVLFEENFQGMSGGSLANGAEATTGSFAVDNRGGYVGVVADPAGGSHGHVLSVYDYNRLGNVPSDVRANFATGTTSAIRLSYDIYHDTSAFTSPAFSEAGVFVEGAARATYHYTTVIDPNTAGFHNYSTTTPGGWTFMTPLNMRTWYRVVYELADCSVANPKSLVSVFNINADGSTGSMVYSNANIPTFTGTAVPSYNWLRFGQSGGAGRSNYYLDNIKVETVPEPATSALMLLGGASVLARRRKK